MRSARLPGARRHNINDPDSELADGVIRAMTVCIAAECEHNGERAIVLCSDVQGTDFAKSADTHKVRSLEGKPVAMLFSDIPGAALEFWAAVRPLATRLAESSGDDIAISQFMADLRNLTRQRKQERVADFVARTYGLDDLEAFYRVADGNMLAAARGVGLDCELLLCHAAKADAMIVHVDNQGQSIWEHNYRCIGSGWAIARAFLSQMNWNRQMSPVECAGRLLSAKQMAEKDVYVSKETQIFVLFPGKPMHSFSAEGVSAVEACKPILKPSKAVASEDRFYSNATQG